MKSPLSRTTIGRLSRPAERSVAGGGMKRAVGWTKWSVALACVATVLTVGTAAATPPSGLTNVPLARGTNTSRGTIPLQFDTDIAIAQITVNPGGPLAGTRIREVRLWSSSRVRSPSTHRSVATARPPRTVRGRRSSSDLAKWMTSSTTGRSHTPSTSPSPASLRATPRELTSQTLAYARDYDVLVERDLPRGKRIAPACPDERGR